MYIASFRLAIALVCVGVSLILSAQWLGLMPDPIAMTMRARQARCETVAINAAAHVRKRQWVDLETTLRTVVERDSDLLSIGIRSSSGVLRVDTGHHDEMFPKVGEDLSVDTLHVPITLNRRPWGDVEFCFRRAQPSLGLTLLRHSTFQLVCYFVVAGLGAYTLFVARVMGVFSRTQVVPDRVRQALDTLAEGLLVLDENRRIVLANSAFAGTVGLTSEQLTEKTVDELAWIYDSDEPQDRPWVRAIESGELRTEAMLRYRLESGRERIFSVNAAPLGTGQDHRGALATFRDVTHVEEHRVELERMLVMLRSSRDEISRKNRELEILATLDALTGCLNRRAFFERFEKHWDASKAKGQPLACVMIDNDHFKSVNDTYGHHVGDEVLRVVSKVIRDLHEKNDLVCRYGGEEFCVVLPGRTRAEAAKEAEKIRVAISQIRLTEPAELRLTASLGVSDLNLGASDPQDLINQADTCLYIAKRGGRNQVVIFDPTMAEVDQDESLIPRTSAESVEPKLPFQAVMALVSALAYRDASTAEHSRRVADLCVKAADGLLDQRGTYLLEIAALLHDIGKIGIPDHVLLKPGPLTAEEWSLMGSHDRIGVEIVAGTFDCHELAEIVRTHRSYYGGRSNSPHLPIGEQIPLAARLLAIADSYDAMVTHRVFRNSRTHDEAIRELRRCAVSQFDPRLVEHFIEKISGSELAASPQRLVVPKQVAVQIGLQIERLAFAIDNHDAAGLKVLVSRLGKMAQHCNIDAIAEAARRIESKICEDESIEWLTLLQETQHLLDCCRSTQNSFLTESSSAPLSLAAASHDTASHEAASELARTQVKAGDASRRSV